MIRELRQVRAADGALLAALGFAIGACASLAQGAYPNRPINILTPTTAGSGMEVQLRLISQVIQRKSGQPFVVEPKPGTMGMIAATNIARARPDGYSLLITPNSPLVFNQLTQKTMGYDPQAFRSVSMISSQPLLMGVRGDFPVKTINEFID